MDSVREKEDVQLQEWDKTHPSDSEIARQVAADPDSAPILTREERKARSFVRMPKKNLR